jgi:hypothetical protein
MLEYNKNTKEDFTVGYDPKSLDEFYKNAKTYDKDKSTMPAEVDGEFNVRYSTVQLEKETLEELEEMFCKYKSDNDTTIYPRAFLTSFKK